MKTTNNPAGIPFDKPSMSLNETMELLRNRGMIFENEERAKHYLSVISYYRLSVYMLPFQFTDGSVRHHCFKKPIAFETVLRLYSFDRRIRLLSMDALERIEVAFRTVMMNCLTDKCGAFWLANADCFHDKNKRNTHAAMLEEIERQIDQQRSAPCIDHYYGKYSSPRIPPAWIVFEILPFGCVSRIYENLKRPFRKAIAEKFGVEESILQSWLHALSVLRNSCAHHSRVWNRKYPFKIKASSAFPELNGADRFYCLAMIINLLLKSIVQTPTWAEKLKNTITEFSDVVNPVFMGFPADWEKSSLFAA